LMVTLLMHQVRSHIWNPGGTLTPVSSSFVKTMVFADVNQEKFTNSVYGFELLSFKQDAFSDVE
jgi:hypothetical protein